MKWFMVFFLIKNKEVQEKWAATINLKKKQKTMFQAFIDIFLPNMTGLRKFVWTKYLL